MKKIIYSWLILTLSISYIYSQEHISKEEQWEQLSNDVDHWADGIGYPIDPEIKIAVVALNILGIETRQSCEGHLDRGTPYPWVDFDFFTPEYERYQTQQSEVHEKYKRQLELVEAMYPDLTRAERNSQPESEVLDDLFQQFMKLSSKFEEIQRAKMAPIYSLLNEFYQVHEKEYDCMLIISGYCLQSLGADWQYSRTDEEKQIKLQQYREEMNKFALFLKHRFFNFLP